MNSDPFNNDMIELLTQQFALSWESDRRPSIEFFLGLAEPKIHTALLESILPIDIRQRQEIGLELHPRDYQQIGPDAVSIAKRLLYGDESRNSPKTSPNAATECDSQTVSPLDETNFASRTADDDDQDFSVVEQSSDFIDSYKLLQIIGQGGMGSVWMAEQFEPVRRKVALKVIREDLGSPQNVARFEAERQAVAMMDHQNIARILDAGTTPSGNPYFAMELVNGVPLNVYCDENKLNVRERLQLMIPVCRAIQHAHQKGIIHRDLKNSNVLVTQYDGEPVPKVIDFGLAKSLEQHQRLTDKTMFTEYGKVVGTLQYMSPEQASLDGMDVDTRCDIYALGIMIYKLLTGSTPLADSILKGNSLVQTLQLIREQDPPCPSNRLSSTGDSSTTVAELRRSTPEKVRLEIKGDLDWIVMKALEKDRNRRYETATGLALDIERFLADEPVRARPPSTSYRLSKFVKRNRGLVGTLAISSFLLIAGIVGTSFGLAWALNERNRANDYAANAERQTSIARDAEKVAVTAERKHRLLKTAAEKQLHAIQSKSAWSEWQLGNVESAWNILTSVNADLAGWEIDFLRTEFSTSTKVLYGHCMKIHCIDVARDGSCFATAAGDNTIKLWNAADHQLILTVETEDTPVCIPFSPDSKTIACGDRSNRVTVWDVASGKKTEELGPYSKDITSLVFSSDGKSLIIGESLRDSYRLENQRLKRDPSMPNLTLIDLKSRVATSFKSNHAKDIHGLAIDPNGNTLVSCGADGLIQVWEKHEQSWQVKHSHKQQSSEIHDVDVSPDGMLLASCGQDMTVRIWELESGKLMSTCVGHYDQVQHVQFSPQSDLLVSASADHTARVWNIAGKQLQKCQGHFDGLNAVALSTDASEILSGSEDQTVRVWETLGSQRTIESQYHTDDVWDAAFSPDGNRLVSVSETGLLSMIDLRNKGKELKTIKHDQAVLSVTWSPTAEVFVTGGADGKLRVFDSNDCRLLKLIDAHSDFIWDVAFSPDGTQLATASSDKTGKVWNTADWSMEKQLDDHQGELGSARFSGDGRFLVTSSDDGSIILWENGTFRNLHSFVGHHNAVWRAIFSPDSKRIASSGSDGEMFLWDVASREKIWSIKAHSNQIAGLTFSKDSARLITASDDQTIKLWDVVSGLEMFLLRDRDDSASIHVEFSNDGSKLVSGNADGWVTVRFADPMAESIDLFFPSDAIELMIDGLALSTSGKATRKDYERILEEAQKCCKFFPSFQTYTVAGVCLYRLDRFRESIEFLLKARRQEPIEYGEPDVRPDIEGYLTMSYLKIGKHKLAEEVGAVFETKNQISLWQDDESVVALRKEVNQLIAEKVGGSSRD